MKKLVHAQPSSEAIQRKVNQPAPPQRPTPQAPPPYRPQATPRCLQPKTAAATQPSSLTMKRAPAAPPAYRPQPAPVTLQAKPQLRPPLSSAPRTMPAPLCLQPGQVSGTGAQPHASGPTGGAHACKEVGIRQAVQRKSMAGTHTGAGRPAPLLVAPLLVAPPLVARPPLNAGARGTPNVNDVRATRTPASPRPAAAPQRSAVLQRSVSTLFDDSSTTEGSGHSVNFQYLAQQAKAYYTYEHEGATIGADLEVVVPYDATPRQFSGSRVFTVGQIDLPDFDPYVLTNSTTGNPGSVVKEWASGELRSSPIAKKVQSASFMRAKTGKESTAHAEVNIYRKYNIQSVNEGHSVGELPLHIGTNIGHCAECYWAAHAIFKKWSDNFETDTICSNKIFKSWGEPWVGFYQEYGDNPFRDSSGNLRSKFSLSGAACATFPAHVLNSAVSGSVGNIYS
jgi:hypothetical protein